VTAPRPPFVPGPAAVVGGRAAWLLLHFILLPRVVDVSSDDEGQPVRIPLPGAAERLALAGLDADHPLHAEVMAAVEAVRLAGVAWDEARNRAESSKPLGPLEGGRLEPAASSWHDRDELTAAEAAEVLGVTSKAVRRMLAAGRLTGSQVGEHRTAAWLVDRVSVVAELERRRAA
jgi:excisionase family DNA binding protein